MKNFGIAILGQHMTIRINTKLSNAERTALADAYPDINIFAIAKGLTRIEGCMEINRYIMSFKPEYKLAMLRSQQSFLQEKIDGIEEMVSGVDLPF